MSEEDKATVSLKMPRDMFGFGSRYTVFDTGLASDIGSVAEQIEAQRPHVERAARISEAKEAVCEAAKELKEARKPAVNTTFLGRKMDLVNAELALDLAVNALIKAEGE